RILMLTAYFAPDSAANAVIMTRLAKDLAGIGHQVTVLTTFPHYGEDRFSARYRSKLWAKERIGEISVYRLFLFVPKKKGMILGRLLSYVSWNVLSALAGLMLGRCDILFVPSPPLTNGFVGYIISRLRGVPFVYNVQDIYPDIAVRLGVLRQTTLIGSARKLETFVYGKAAAVSVISGGFRSNLIAKGVPEEKIHLIPNFAETEVIHPLARQNRLSSALGLDDRFVVLYAGNIGLSQGLETVLDAAELLRDNAEIVFLIVGNGATKPALVDLARRKDLQNVMFRPFFPYRDVPELYATSDVCLVPLKRGISEESVPSKAYSILAAGRPLIAAVDEGSNIWDLV
ncbi:MAG: glycosyltransferase family 4 protein, partial [Deltaproteobacteria bacterium]|nr:glycosyltransferase family 4 protein [Candidatus Zymogenaceae bacterium]